jgi:MICOS complex subunit MIC60
LELQSNNAKQLWLAVQSLSQTLSSSIVDSSNQEIASIKSSVDKIKQSAPENDFIKKIIDSIPTNALEIGVWTEPDLKERFYRLKTLCSRVALIDERGGSLFKYFISYLQSFFIMHAKIDAHENLPVSLNEINLNSTFSILDHAQYYIENGNIESAIRLMQQLKGEPYMLARDWIKEAILLLEIKQACQLLTAYISSVYISTNFK